MQQGSVRDFRSGGLRSARCMQCLVQRLPYSPVVLLHAGDVGPVSGSIGRQTVADRIDSKCEKLVECCVARREVQSRREKVPIKRLQMSQVKDQTMALGYGAVVKRIRRQAFKQRVGPRASLFQARQQSRVKLRRYAGSRHSSPRRQGSLFTTAGSPGASHFATSHWMRETASWLQL